MATTIPRTGARRRHRHRHKPRREPPMGLYAAIATLGADQVALTVDSDQPFGPACRQKIDTTLGPERTAWRAIAHHGANACRDALAGHGIYLFRRDPH